MSRTKVGRPVSCPRALAKAAFPSSRNPQQQHAPWSPQGITMPLASHGPQTETLHRVQPTQARKGFGTAMQAKAGRSS